VSWNRNHGKWMARPFREIMLPRWRLVQDDPPSFADISDDDPPMLPIYLFDNECTPGEL
jgi:hypothetical protein